MASNTRDRSGKAMELLGPALNRSLTAKIDSELPDRTTWIDLLRLKDNVRHRPAERTYDADGLSNGLRLITDNYRRGWRPFDQHLSRMRQAYVTELRDIRNKHAHMEASDNDATRRALEAHELRLTAIHTPNDAENASTLGFDNSGFEIE